MLRNSLLTAQLLRVTAARAAPLPRAQPARLARGYLHIKNMEKERRRAEIQRDFDRPTHVETYDKVYKPSAPIEFNRTGEVLLYSCDPFKHKTIYLKYPYVLFESLSPLMAFQFVANPLHLPWAANYAFLFGAFMLWFPRFWYLNSMQYRIRRVWLMRGGKFLKLERSSLAGDQYTNWIEIRHLRPLTEDFKEFEDDEADFLTAEGQLKHELGAEAEHFRQWGTTMQDVNIFFMKEGTVHQPELFEAVVKGFHVDTSDFTINTLLDERTREPHHNY